MLRLPIQQALKCLRHPLRNPLRDPLCNPLRNTLCNPLRNPLQTRHIYSWEVPGPASYATLNQHFSLYPKPLILFTEKKEKEAMDRREFIDIHDDFSDLDPNHFDVLIPDVDDSLLRSDISELVGIPYLKEATKDEASQLLETGSGFIYGRHSRLIFPCIVGFEDKAHWVFFIVDSGAPFTYLSRQVGETLGLSGDRSRAATIAGYRHAVQLSPKPSHFSEVNILGMDFLDMSNLRFWPDYDKRTVAFYFGKKWEGPKPKL